MRQPRTLLIAALVSCLLHLGVSRETGAQTAGLQSQDLYRLQSVSDVHVSPDATRIVYSVEYSDRPGKPYSQIWVMDVKSGTSSRLGSDQQPASHPRWSPDGQRIAYFSNDEDGGTLVISRPDGSGAVRLAAVQSTNHPLPSSGARLSWSPDGKRIAFISATPGPETEDANGDPMVITRYLYKPTASEGMTRFNDNRRLHIFVVEVDSRRVTQLTDGHFYEHSIDWSPRGEEIVFISNREPDPDRFFNYDIFTVNAQDRSVRRVTDTKNAEYRPVWSPDGTTLAYLGTTRDLTSSETTMEDTHVWLIERDGSNRRELGKVDNRQGVPGWAPDGRAVLTTIQERGNVRLYRLPVGGGAAEVIAPSGNERGRVGSWSIAQGVLAFTLETPQAPSELYVKRGDEPSRGITSLNRELLTGRNIAEVESVEFTSFDGTPAQAFLTKPVGLNPSRTYPLITMIKGGPHGQQGPTFNAKAQAYANHGFAVLMVNYRGSTGYGQAFADAIFGDQNGGEAKDVLAGVDAALKKYPWLDPGRLGVEGGSYGGQLTNWLITQTDRFKAAIPAASISNLVSFNYMAYYHDYLAVEFGLFPHETWAPGKRPAEAEGAMHLMDFLWERSPLRYVSEVETPTMLIHGENDNDVPIAEAEQYFIALKDVGVEAVMVRYPREGHGIRETSHVVDIINRSLLWYDGHFKKATSSQH